MQDYTDRYPILKDTVRIKKFSNFCWITELISDCNQAATPTEAFLLANCSGEWNLKQIRYLFGKTYNLQTANTEELVHKVLRKFINCLDWSDRPGKTAADLNPCDFLYRTCPGALAAQERCDTPTELFLSLTNLCNFRCIYCFNASGTQKSQEMETEQWLNFIRQAGEAGILKCTLTGGEPMLYPGFYDILEELARFHIMPYVCTNGSLIDADAIQRFHAADVRVVQISMDSAAPDVHHKLTATTDSFDRVIQGIERLTAAGIAVHVKSVLTPFNLDNIHQLIALCNRIGVTKLTLDRFDVSSCGRGGANLLITEQQMEAVKSYIAANHRQIANQMTVAATANKKRWQNENDIVPCGAFRRSMVVLPDGNVSVCEKLTDIPEMTVGNICRDSLMDIWTSPKIADILSPAQNKLDGTCQNCEHLNKCGTGCFAIKYFLQQGPFQADPRCWKAEKNGNPYAAL